MGGEWRAKSFAELVGGAENVIGGPFGSNLTQADYVGSGVPVIRGSNMGQNGRFIGGEFAFVAREKAATLATNEVVAGDVVVTQRGTLGQVSLVSSKPAHRYIVSQSQMGVRVSKADPLFVYYLLRSQAFAEFLAGSTIQTGVPHINLTMLREWRVRTPELPLQRRISAVMGALDDKIELNSRMAETLEAMARALFKSWFVDFDPVRAKAEGRPTGLPDDSAALFPDRFSDDGLPEGWDRRPLSSLAHFLNGLALQKYPAAGAEHSLPVIKIAEMTGGPTSKSDRASLAVPTAYHVNDGDHLFAWSGSLGHCQWTHGPGALNQHLFKVTPNEGIPGWFVYEAVELHMEEFRSIASDKAVTMGHIQRKHLDAALVATPSNEVLGKLSALIAPIESRFLATALESRTLAALRDALLPKLISGELRVADAEQQVSAA